jgi:hypothetical protein
MPDKVYDALLVANLSGRLAALECCPGATDDEFVDALSRWVATARKGRPGVAGVRWCAEQVERLRGLIARSQDPKSQALARRLAAVGFEDITHTVAEVERLEQRFQGEWRPRT